VRILIDLHIGCGYLDMLIVHRIMVIDPLSFGFRLLPGEGKFENQDLFVL
jgi:hypothetical protein